MRLLNEQELGFVSGAVAQCTPENTRNNYGGLVNPGGVGDDIVSFYEGLVAATSHIIERVANALG